MELTGISPFSGDPQKVVILDSRITESEKLNSTFEEPDYLSPGFIDIQVNGSHGADYSSKDLDGEQLYTIVSNLASSGTTTHLPTIITSPQERILRNLELIRKARAEDELLRFAIPGIHIEGPYISPQKGARGVHDLQYIRKPDIHEYREWQAAAGDTVSLVTIAPEIEGALPFIEELSADGVVVALGHTSATPEIIRKAIAAGAQLSSHIGNGSARNLPRLRNFLWAQLAADELYASIIVDGHHLPVDVVKVVTRSKGLDKLVLISDIAPAAGLSPGVYRWDRMEVEVFEDGHLGMPGTEFLAGAAHSLDWNIAHFIRYTGQELGASLGLCTANPAKLLGFEHPGHELARGDIAHLVCFGYESSSSRLEIRRTIIGGKEVYRAEAS